MHTEGKVKIYESGEKRHLYTGDKGDEIVIAGLAGENADADAKHLIKCWNAFEPDGSHALLLTACKAGVAPNVIQEYIFWLDDRIKASYCAMWKPQLKGLRRVLEIMLEQTELQMQAIAEAEGNKKKGVCNFTTIPREVAPDENCCMNPKESCKECDNYKEAE